MQVWNYVYIYNADLNKWIKWDIDPEIAIGEAKTMS